MDSSISLSLQTHLTSPFKSLHTLDTLLILCPLGVFFRTPTGGPAKTQPVACLQLKGRELAA